MRIRTKVLSFVCIAGGIVAGATMPSLLGGPATAGQKRVDVADEPLRVIHAPLKLHTASDPATLRFDISCLPPDGNAEGAGTCDGGGTVYLKSSGNVTSTLPLQYDSTVDTGRYYINVPGTFWNASWFDYYAVIKDNTTGATLTFPQGGSGAPQYSFLVSSPTLSLGTHTFGATQQPTARVASATWGSGTGQAGIEVGNDQPAGASSFDVDSSGNVYLLDEANYRMLEFTGGAFATQVPLSGLEGVRGDLRVDTAAGVVYVLETPDANQATPTLRSFTLSGTPINTAPLADIGTNGLQIYNGTAYASEYPSSIWSPVMQNNGATRIDAATQFSSGAAGWPGSPGNFVVATTDSEIRVGLYTGSGLFTHLTRSLRILSDTPVADIQLVQTLPSGNLVVVFSVYTDTDHEYEVVVASPTGSLVEAFSVPENEYAITMPQSHFKLVGSSLYALGSDTNGAFVDRYDLGVN